MILLENAKQPNDAKTSKQLIYLHTYLKDNSKSREAGGYFVLPSKAVIEAEYVPIP